MEAAPAIELLNAYAACDCVAGLPSFVAGYETLKNFSISALASPTEPTNISLLVLRKS